MKAPSQLCCTALFASVLFPAWAAFADGPCGDPAAGSCFVIHATPGCADSECCSAICDIDPYCCTTQWDAVCRQQANDAPICGVPIPANDAPTAPAFVTVGLVAFSTVGASDSSVTSIPADCGGIFGDIIRRDVWFEYRASVTGTVRFSTCPEAASGSFSEFDPILVLRDPVTLESLACNDEALGCAGYAVLNFAVTAGDRYLIQIGGHDTEIGNGAMRVTETGTPAAPPVNDACAGATNVALPAAGATIPFDLLRAAVNDASCGSEAADVWLRVGPFPGDGTARLEACSADAAARLEVSTGDCNAPRACSGADACGDDASLTIDVAADGFILVRVASVAAAQGTLSVEFTEVPQCPADLNGDGEISAADLSLVLLGWGTSAADIDGDGDTSAADLSLVLEAWGKCG